MPATFGIAAAPIAGMARSYAARLSLFIVFACGDEDSPASGMRELSGCRIKPGMTNCPLLV
jgi:hypothetical protein